MKNVKKFIILSFLFLSLLVFPLSTIAYDSGQLLDCIDSAKQNKALEGISDSSIQNYCDCALDLILDQEKNVRESGYECATKSFQ